jgi:YggT family protein
LDIVCWLLQAYFYALFLRIILSWFPVSSGSFLAALNGALYTITEPVLGPLRRAIPPVRIGMAGLDLSPMIVLIGIQLLRGFLGC